MLPTKKELEMSVPLSTHQIFVSLIFLVLGTALMLGAHKISQYNKRTRLMGLKSAEQEAEKSDKSFTLKSVLWKATSQAGKYDQISIILVAVTVIAMGLFLLFNPNGW